MSSIITLGVLREHKDTLLAMLEAFALDPLLTWQAKEVENPAGESDFLQSSFYRAASDHMLLQLKTLMMRNEIKLCHPPSSQARPIVPPILAHSRNP